MKRMSGKVCRIRRILILAGAATCIPATAATLEGRVVAVSDGDTITMLDLCRCRVSEVKPPLTFDCLKSVCHILETQH